MLIFLLLDVCSTKMLLCQNTHFYQSSWNLHSLALSSLLRGEGRFIVSHFVSEWSLREHCEHGYFCATYSLVHHHYVFYCECENISWSKQKPWSHNGLLQIYQDKWLLGIDFFFSFWKGEHEPPSTYSFSFYKATQRKRLRRYHLTYWCFTSKL